MGQSGGNLSSELELMAMCWQELQNSASIIAGGYGFPTSPSGAVTILNLYNGIKHGLTSPANYE